MIGFLDLFVPLTGRMGADAPVDFIIAILVGALGLVALPMVSLSCAHGWTNKNGRRLNRSCR